MRAALALLAMFLAPGLACAAGGNDHLDVPVWTLAPFVVLLLCIALLPLVAGRWWHKNWAKLLVAVGLSVPVIGLLTYFELVENQPGLDKLTHALIEYVEFIVLLAALYVISGGIAVQMRVRPSPFANTTLLAFGAVLANFIGTTGASMLLIRPLLRMNRDRQHRRHVPIFFIFLVSNLGGLLTPLGDPPLFLGFLRGVDFFWMLRLWPMWAVANGAVLIVFFFWDMAASLRDAPLPDDATQEEPEAFRMRGWLNFALLGGVLAAVFVKQDDVARQITDWARQYWPDCPDHMPWGTNLMILMGLVSWLLTPRTIRHANHFEWDPILEVAILFLGIFITMVPALEYLKSHGRELGLEDPWQFFWITGLLSSFLDNAPTYLTFAVMAGESDNLGLLMNNQPHVLAAISCGAVFMGANTYIGNGPNFMVKAIADRGGYAMPSFFGYMLYSIFILLPIFAAVTWLFFWE